jgi:hypothetical protein
MKYKCLYILFFLVLLSCEERTDWELDTKEVPLLVVDGTITNEKKPHRVVLTKPVTELNQKPAPVSGALVAITDGDSVYILTEDGRNPGTYYTEPEVQGVPGKTYYLYVKIGEEEFYGGDYMAPVQDLKPLSYHKIEGYELYELDYKESKDASAMYVYFDWSYLVDEAEKESARAFVHYYTLKSIDVNEIFKPTRERVFFPAGTIILRRKYSLSGAYQNFLRSLMMETEWKGGVFDVMPANVVSNIRGRAGGFFNASMVVSDTSLVKVLP